MKISAFLYKRPTASGLYHVYIRISHKGESIERSLGYQIAANEWDDSKKRVKSKTNIAKHINSTIENIALKASSIHMNHLVKGTPIILDEILPKVDSSHNYIFTPGTTPKKITLKVSDLYNAYIDYLEAEEKYFTVDKMKSHRRKFINFQDIPAASLSLDYVQAFKSFWRSKGNSDNTVSYNIKKMCDVLNFAVKKGLIKSNPIAGVKIKFTKTIKSKLNRNEIETLKSADLTPAMKLALDCWLLSWLMRGTRVKDMLELKWDHVQDGRIIVSASKTSKEQTMRITPEMKTILDRLPRTCEYIFPYLEGKDMNGANVVNAIKGATAKINSNLKRMRIKLGIEKKITMHISRHSFASIADKSGLSMRTIQQLLNHGSFQMTEIYVNDLRMEDEMDQAADVVYGNVDGRMN
jgi:integrase